MKENKDRITFLTVYAQTDVALVHSTIHYHIIVTY